MKNKITISLIGIFVAWLASGQFSPTYAQLIINEVFPSPLAGSGEAEWIEIYNVGTQKIDLTDWSLAKNVGLATEKRSYLSELETIAPQQFLFFTPSSTKVPLANDGATIYLLNGDEIIDTITYPKLNNQSYARVPDGSEDWQITEPTRVLTNNQPSSSPIPTSTPAQNNDVATTYNHDLSATEIYSCSLTDEKEWLEVQNHRAQSQSLTGWKLKNQSGLTRILSDVTLSPQSLTVLEFTSGLLTNDGGSVTLFDPNNSEVWTITFPACAVKGTSFIKTATGWLETTNVTKGATNPSEVAASQPTTTTSSPPTGASKIPTAANNSTPPSTNNPNNSDNTDTSKDNTEKKSPPFTYKTPNYKIKRVAPATRTMSNNSDSNSGQVLGSATATASAKITTHISPHFWILIVGGLLFIALPILYYFITKAKENGELDDTY